MRSHAKWREEDGWCTLIHQLIRIRRAKIGPPHLNISSHAQSLILGTFYTNPGASILSLFTLSLSLSLSLCCVIRTEQITEQKTLLAINFY